MADEFLKKLGIDSETKSSSWASGADKAMSAITVPSDDVLKGFGIDPEKAKAEAKPKKVQELRNRVETAAPRLRGYTDQVVTGMPIVSPVMDYTTAAAGAGIQPMLNADKAKQTFGERFSNNLDAIRGTTKQFSEENPVGSTAANVVGATLSTLPLMATRVGSALFGNVGPNVPAKMLVGGTTGGVIGATDSAMRGENPFVGGVVGAGGGALGPAAAKTVQSVVTGVLDKTVPRVGALTGQPSANVQLLTGALDGETPASIAAARERMGPAGFLSDLNPAMTDIAGGLADTPGAHKALVREAYINRQLGQRNRMDAAFTRDAGPRYNIEDMKGMIAEERKAAADPLYDRWRSMKVQPDDTIKALIPRLEEAGAFKRAEELSKVTGEPINVKFFTGGNNKDFPTTQSWDYIKQGLDRSIDAAYNKGDKTMARALVRLKNETIEAIEKTPAGKVWKEARREFATHSSLLDNLEAGRDTFLGGRSGISVDELRNELKSLSHPERMARIHGMRAALDEAMGETIRGDGVLRAKLLAPNNQEKLKLIVGDKRADNIIKTLKSEEFLSEQKGNVVGNQNTGASAEMRKARREELAMRPTPAWDIDIQRPKSWIPPQIMEQFAPRTIIDAYRSQNHADRLNNLARVMLTPEPQIDDLILAIQNEGARRAMMEGRGARVGNAVSRAVSGPATQGVQRRVQ